MVQQPRPILKNVDPFPSITGRTHATPQLITRPHVGRLKIVPPQIKHKNALTAKLNTIARQVQLLLHKKVRAITAHATILTHGLFYSGFFLYVYVNQSETLELTSPFVTDTNVLLLLLGTLLLPFFSLALLVRYYTYWTGFAVWGLFGAVTAMITAAIRRSYTEVDLLIDTGLFRLERLLSPEQVLTYLEKQAGWGIPSEGRRTACLEAGRKFRELEAEFKDRLLEQLEANRLAEQARKAAEALQIVAETSKSLWIGGSEFLNSPLGLTTLGVIIGVAILALIKAFSGGAAGGGDIYFPLAPLSPLGDFEPGSPWSPEPDSPLSPFSPLSPPPAGVPHHPLPHFFLPAHQPQGDLAYLPEPYNVGDLYGAGAPKPFLRVHSEHIPNNPVVGAGVEFRFLPFDL